MENQNIEPQQQQQQDELWRKWEKGHRRGKVIGGIFIVIAGSLFLARELGAQVPDWVFTWKMLLVAIGLMTGVRHGFRHPVWIVLILVGGAFLVSDLYPAMPLRPLLWPVLIIIFGLFIIFKPRRKHRHMWHRHHWHQHNCHHQHHKRQWKRWAEKQQQHGWQNPWEEMKETSSEEDYIDSTSFMGGVKKKILSKKFKGGDVTNVFGGAEINLMQADIEGSATLDITNVFGGTKLIIPPHWELQTDIVSVFGSTEDKRPVQTAAANETPRVLVLKGTSFFGGIDIKSY